MAYSVSGKFSDGGSWTASAPSNSGNQLVTVVADENISTSDRTTSLLVKNASGGVCSVSVTQEKAVYKYAFILSPSVFTIGAGGGTSAIQGTLVTYRGGVEVSRETVVPVLSGSADGFSISGAVVTASDRGTATGSTRSIKVTGTYSDTFDGQEVQATTTVYQEANQLTYGAITISSFSYSSVSASGGTSSPTVGSVTQALSYTSGASATETIGSGYSYAVVSAVSGSSVDQSTGVVTWAANESLTSRSVAVRLTVTANSRSATRDASCEQSAGVHTYSVPLVSLSYATILASGGTVSPELSYSQTWGWNGSTSGGGTITSGGVVTYSGTSVASDGKVTASSKGVVISDITTVTEASVSVVLNGETGSASFTVLQAANEASYGAVTISGGSVDDIPASGGSVSAMSGLSASQDVSYTSGSTRTGSVDISYSAPVSADSLGVTVTPRSVVGTLVAYADGEGDVSATKALDVYQEANAVESTRYTTWVITISADPMVIPASGGTSTVSASCNRYGYPVYTSGAEGSPYAYGDSASLSGSGDGFTLSGSTVTASANTAFTSRTYTVTASHADATPKSVIITQAAVLAYALVGSSEATATASSYTVSMSADGSKEAIYFKTSDNSQLVTSDSQIFLVGAASGIEDAYIKSNDNFTLKKS